MLDWCSITYPKYSLNGKQVELSGISLLDLVKNRDTNSKRPKNVFGSHILHEVTMYYPMRSARNDQYRLIHNLNYQGPFHIAEDAYNSPTWQQLLKDIENGQPTNWFKNLTDYYFRPQYELYDIKNDKKQINNLAYNQQYQTVFNELKKNLTDWEEQTNDPWRGCNQTTFSC